jgi:hypothetical protein
MFIAVCFTVRTEVCLAVCMMLLIGVGVGVRISVRIVAPVVVCGECLSRGGSWCLNSFTFGVG